MTIGMFFMGLAFLFIPPLIPNDPTPYTAGPWAYVVLISMVAYCCAYALGLGNVPWVVQTEVFADFELRAVGSGLATGKLPPRNF